MNSIKSLNPSLVWKYFDEITKIPRPSGKEEKVTEYLIRFAKEHKLEYKTDKVGNVVIIKNATKGRETNSVIILQSHTDMVCEKNSDTLHNFETDPITTLIEGKWVKAKGTTLGADNGIGIAAQLAVLAADNLAHNTIECLFTVEEETGLVGAFGLADDMLSGKYLINLDSEDDGEVFIGCAGGIDTKVSYPFATRTLKNNYCSYKIRISGLKGGHSGDDINKGLGNAIKLLARFLNDVNKEVGIKMSNIQGGNLSNAIPREATTTISLKESEEETFLFYLNEFTTTIRDEYKNTEPDITIRFDTVVNPQNVLPGKNFNQLMNAITVCPNGVIDMSYEVSGLVETSSNLASIKTLDNTIEMVLSHRSSVNSKKTEIKNRISSLFALIKANISHKKEYPGWQPKLDSILVNIAKESHQSLFSKAAKVKAIHAGLECGLFLEKYPDLEMISIGPTIKGAHSPDERLEIETVSRFWDFLTDILKRIE